MQISIGLAASVLPEQAGQGGVTLLPPENLLSPAQSTFSQPASIDLRNNWAATPGNLRQIAGNGSTFDVRLNLDQPILPGHPHFAVWQTTPGTIGTYKAQFGGAGSLTGSSKRADETRPKAMWLPADSVTSPFTRFGFNPFHDDLDLQFSQAAVYDLSSVDPATTVCDVVLCLGDSNISNAVSEEVSDANLTVPYDPRVWYMPCLRMNPYEFAFTNSARHVPQPCLEPVQASAGGNRISPLQAFGSEFVTYAAGRGRPLLLLSLGDAGSGFNGTEDWRKSSSVATTGNRMYDEMMAMLSAMRSLGPAHECVGAIVSLGANDTTGVDYDTAWLPHATQFVADLRSEALIDNATLPIAWMTVGEHYEPLPDEDRGARMISAIESMDQDSGSAWAIPGVRSVRPPAGHALSDAQDPHYLASGMVANGQIWASTLRSLMSS